MHYDAFAFSRNNQPTIETLNGEVIGQRNGLSNGDVQAINFMYPTVAVGDPFGYAFVNETTGLTEQHNLFRSADGHIHALWFNFAEGWHHEDRG